MGILASLRWLTTGAAAGDELFFHYSGHGGQQADKNGDEASGKDDTLIPCDFQTAGQIIDDELYEHVVEPLPKGVRMWVMLDCCHSGTALDLPFVVDMSSDGRTVRMGKSKMRRGPPAESKADVIMISGCKDTQTSADVQAGSMGMAKAAGAMTTAFRHCVNPSLTCEDLLVKMRDYLKRNNYVQVPQMSSEQYIQLDAPFVSYAAQPHHKRAPPKAAAAVTLAAPAVAPGSPMMPQAVSPMGSPMMNHQATTPIHGLQAGSPMMRQGPWMTCTPRSGSTSCRRRLRTSERAPVLQCCTVTPRSRGRACMHSPPMG